MRRWGLALLVFATVCNKSDEAPMHKDGAEANAAEGQAAEGKLADAKAPEGKTAEGKTDPDAKSDADADGKTAPEISGDRLLVLADDELRRLAPSGKTQQVVAAPKVDQCDVDDAHRVVWLASATELSAYDPADGKVHPVARGYVAPGGEHGTFAWQIQRRQPGDEFPVAVAGSADGLEDCVALVVTIGKKVGVAGEAVAEGDREWYCYEEDEGGGARPGPPKLQPEPAAVKAGYDKAKLVDAAFLSALEARHGKDGPLVRPQPEAPPAPKVKVDRSQCVEDPEACGDASYLGGERLWRIVTANDRGDFFHEEQHIYDTKVSKWWDPKTGKHLEAPDEGESAVAASPDRVWGTYGDKILSLVDAKEIGTFSGDPCGWQ